ncbi:hypothetical protein L249_7135 [Ophiocordyceps polyrhachis-furcata BCC 54312]|uniref:Uncharacterized protein n=1 Tax=Ophiocordyceps polyrhachis-furcata BCC 54312 TaxID=1330021 RepID=A0A367LAB4_9HYPO|nr:hypothetical protein L249_7135 [Ophiocordyceps polyrhachis-furcata BCC 54312]
MWNSTGINVVNRLNLGILLNNVSSASCAATLETNGYVRGITVSGILGGLVCAGTTVPPAWVFDGNGSGRVATISHLRVPDRAGYAVWSGRHDGNESYWEFIDQVRPGSNYRQTPDWADGCGDKGICTGSLTVRGGTRYGVSFTGDLGIILCSNFTLAPAPVDGGPGNDGPGVLTGLRSVDISTDSSVGIHQLSDGEPSTLVVGQNRTIVWPGWLNGSNWRDRSEGASWRHHCSSSGCASCRTRCSGDCLGEMTSDLTLDELLGRRPGDKVARQSWHTLPPDVVPSSVEILPMPRLEALPVLEARVSPWLPSLLCCFDYALSPPPAGDELTGLMTELCQLLTTVATDDVSMAGKRGAGAVVGGSQAATGAANLLGIRKGRVLSNGAAARILAAGGGQGGGAAGAVVVPLISNLALQTACGLITGTTEVKYDADSEAGRAIEAWGKMIAGEGLSTREWAKLWRDFLTTSPWLRQLVGLATGETTVGINQHHPLMRAVRHYNSRPIWDWCEPDFTTTVGINQHHPLMRAVRHYNSRPIWDWCEPDFTSLPDGPNAEDSLDVGGKLISRLLRSADEDVGPLVADLADNLGGVVKDLVLGSLSRGIARRLTEDVDQPQLGGLAGGLVDDVAVAGLEAEEERGRASDLIRHGLGCDAASCL